MRQAGARMAGLALRATLGLAAAGCTVLAYRYAEVSMLRANAPLEAAKIEPHDAKALAHALGSRIDNNPELKPSVGDLADIRAALQAQPLEPKLLSIMGLTYEASGDKKLAAIAMRVANRVSRHDSISGLYLIESTSASGDVKATIKQYNVVLLTHPDLYAALLPILSAAITYPEIRMELRPYLQIGAKWAPAFLALAAEKSSVTDLQALLLPLPKALLGEEYATIMAGVLHRFVIEGDRASAMRFAAAVVPNLPFNSLSSLSLDPPMRDPRLGQFAWTFPPANGLRAEVGVDQLIQINAEPLASGIVAVRDLLVEGGKTYKLVQHLDYSSSLAPINARWSADCITQNGASRFWEQNLPISGVEGGVQSYFDVPHGCKVARLTLSIDGPDGQMPATLSIKEVTLSRLNNN